MRGLELWLTFNFVHSQCTPLYENSQEVNLQLPVVRTMFTCSITSRSLAGELLFFLLSVLNFGCLYYGRYVHVGKWASLQYGVWRPTGHIMGHFRKQFYGSVDPTNSIITLKDNQPGHGPIASVKYKVKNFKKRLQRSL